SDFPATKDFLETSGGVYLASSGGLFYSKTARSIDPYSPIIQTWCKRICQQKDEGIVWVSSVSGLFKVKDGKVLDTLFKEEGVQELRWVDEEKTLYLSLLSGKIYRIPKGE